jgi:hypothetical protein
MRRRPPDGYRLADRGRFRRLAELTLRGLGGQVGAAVAAADVTVEEVPPTAEGTVLADFEPAGGGQPARLTLYRRPLELRAESKADLVELIRASVRAEVGDVLGLDDEP